MSNTISGAALAVALFAATALADGPKSESKAAIEGTIAKVDPSAHMLTVTTFREKKPINREFKLHSTTRFVFYSASGKKEVRGKEAYKNKDFKEGAKVAVVIDSTEKVTEVRVGTPPKKDR